jgi:alpha-tubulin suppressor-like RCC1 family protein
VDDAVYCWGHSQAVPGWPETPDVPVRVPFDGAVRFLTVGRRHACLLDGEGKAHCWGFNVDGETGTGTGGIDGPMVAAPSPVATDQRFRMLSAGMGFTCGVTVEGDVLCWGSNIDWIIGPEAPDRCGDVTPIPCTKRPVAVPLPEPATMVSSGTGHACAVTVGGTVLCWGSNGAGQVGAYNAAVPRVRAPAAVSVPRSGPFVAVSSGGILTCALANSRKVYCWGADQLHLGEDIDPTAVGPRVAAGGTQFRSISAGSLHACGIDTRGRVLCWGDTIRGALGAR